MATYKAGQRVRKIAHMGAADKIPELRYGSRRAPIGTEGTVRGISEFGGYSVKWDGYPSKGSTKCWRVLPYMMAPLTDPAADAFIEGIKKLKPYEEPTVE